MASINPETIIITRDSGSSVDRSTEEINVPKIVVVDAIFSGNLNSTPAADLVFTGTPQTLTGKTIDLSGAGKLTYGQNGTYNLPPLNGTDDTLVLAAAAQTIGSKTIDLTQGSIMKGGYEVHIPQLNADDTILTADADQTINGVITLGAGKLLFQSGTSTGQISFDGSNYNVGSKQIGAAITGGANIGIDDSGNSPVVNLDPALVGLTSINLGHDALRVGDLDIGGGAVAAQSGGTLLLSGGGNANIAMNSNSISLSAQGGVSLVGGLTGDSVSLDYANITTVDSSGTVTATTVSATGGLVVGGNATLAADLTMNGNLVVDGTLASLPRTEILSSLTLSGALYANVVNMVSTPILLGTYDDTANTIYHDPSANNVVIRGQTGTIMQVGSTPVMTILPNTITLAVPLLVPSATLSGALSAASATLSGALGAASATLGATKFTGAASLCGSPLWLGQQGDAVLGNISGSSGGPVLSGAGLTAIVGGTVALQTAAGQFNFYMPLAVSGNPVYLGTAGDIYSKITTGSGRTFVSGTGGTAIGWTDSAGNHTVLDASGAGISVTGNITGSAGATLAGALVASGANLSGALVAGGATFSGPLFVNASAALAGSTLWLGNLGTGSKILLDPAIDGPRIFGNTSVVLSTNGGGSVLLNSAGLTVGTTLRMSGNPVILGNTSTDRIGYSSILGGPVLFGASAVTLGTSNGTTDYPMLTVGPTGATISGSLSCGALSATGATFSGALVGPSATFSGALTAAGANFATASVSGNFTSGSANFGQITAGGGKIYLGGAGDTGAGSIYTDSTVAGPVFTGSLGMLFALTEGSNANTLTRLLALGANNVTVYNSLVLLGNQLRLNTNADSANKVYYSQNANGPVITGASSVTLGTSNGTQDVAGITVTSGGTSIGGTLTAGSANISSLTGTSANFAGNLAAGSANLAGNLSAASGALSGALSCGNLTVSSAILANSATIGGALGAASATVNGSLAAGSASFNSASVAGTLSCGNLSAPTISSTGTSTLATVNAGNVTLTGTLNAASATLGGTLSAASATLTGSFNATGATLSGGLTTGSVSASGNVGCATLSATSATLAAGLSAANATLSGTLGAAGANLSGALSAGSVSANSATITAGISGGTLSISGAATISGALSANTLTSAGSVSAANANIGGLVSAGSLNCGATTLSSGLSGTSATFTGLLSANSLSTSGNVSCATLSATNGINATSATLSGALSAAGATLSGALVSAGWSTSAASRTNGNLIYLRGGSDVQNALGYSTVLGATALWGGSAVSLAICPGSTPISLLTGTSSSITTSVPLLTASSLNVLTNPIYLNGAFDQNHVLVYDGGVNGPRLSGYAGVSVGTAITGSYVPEFVVNSGNVTVLNALTINGSASIAGLLSANGGLNTSAASLATLNVSGSTVLGASVPIRLGETASYLIGSSGNVFLVGSASLTFGVGSGPTYAVELVATSGKIAVQHALTVGGNASVGGALSASNCTIADTLNVGTVLSTNANIGTLDVTANINMDGGALIYLAGSGNGQNYLTYVSGTNRVVLAGNGGTSIGTTSSGGYAAELVATSGQVSVQNGLTVGGTGTFTGAVYANGNLVTPVMGVGTVNITNSLNMRLGSAIYLAGSGNSSNYLTYNSSTNGAVLTGNSQTSIGTTASGAYSAELVATQGNVTITGAAQIGGLLTATGRISALNSISLNGNLLYISRSVDAAHTLQYDGGVDGPILRGYSGVAFGRMNTGSYVQEMLVSSNAVSVTGNLSVGGATSISGALTANTGTISGALTAGALAVSGNTSVAGLNASGRIVANAALSLLGSPLYISGSVDPSHTLQYDGGVNGPILRGYLGVGFGRMNTGSYVQEMLVSPGNVNVTSGLSVGGAANISGALTTGALTVSGASVLNGNATVGGSLAVVGTTTLGTLNCGSTTVNGTFVQNTTGTSNGNRGYYQFCATTTDTADTYVIEIGTSSNTTYFIRGTFDLVSLDNGLPVGGAIEFSARVTNVFGSLSYGALKLISSDLDSSLTGCTAYVASNSIYWGIHLRGVQGKIINWNIEYKQVSAPCPVPPGIVDYGKVSYYASTSYTNIFGSLAPGNYSYSSMTGAGIGNDSVRSVAIPGGFILILYVDDTGSASLPLARSVPDLSVYQFNNGSNASASTSATMVLNTRGAPAQFVGKFGDDPNRIFPNQLSSRYNLSDAVAQLKALGYGPGTLFGMQDAGSSSTTSGTAAVLYGANSRAYNALGISNNSAYYDSNYYPLGGPYENAVYSIN